MKPKTTALRSYYGPLRLTASGLWVRYTVIKHRKEWPVAIAIEPYYYDSTLLSLYFGLLIFWVRIDLYKLSNPTKL